MRHLATAFLLVSLLAGCGKKENSADKKGTPEAPTPGEVAENGAPDRVMLTADEQQLGGIRPGTLTQRSMSGGLKVNGVLDVPRKTSYP